PTPSPSWPSGFGANLTSVRLFTHRLMSSSSINWHLAALSVSDTTILIASFVAQCAARLAEYLTMCGRSGTGAISPQSPIMYGIKTKAQTASVYLTVGVSVHRYIGVCHPYKAPQLLPKNGSPGVIIGIIAFSILFNITRLF
ncbi:unnamed protein product, partial [Mesorhabditis spiculigera]